MPKKPRSRGRTAKKEKKKRRRARRAVANRTVAATRHRPAVPIKRTRRKQARARRTPSTRRRPAVVQAHHVSPRAEHNLHVSFDAALDAAPQAEATVPVTPAGSTNHFNLFYQTSLGQTGAAIAGYFRSACEYDLQRNANLFGVNWDGLHFTITVVEGSGGAWHPGECSDTNIFAAANTAAQPDNTPNYLFLRALAVSEIVEILGDRFGWNCGWSNGEGLSRAVGDFLVPCQRPGNFLSARMWLDPPSTREDFVTKSLEDDRNYPSIGCSVLFLNWMHYQLGHPWGDIARRGADTLAETYSKVTQQTDPFVQFTALLNSNPAEVDRRASTSDNVFPI